ncbi:MAG: hypothetical protein HGA22_10050, partial [Clostridiales bacterium]|nr:hypothetical protein [Clostridiales bacterium]
MTKKKLLAILTAVAMIALQTSPVFADGIAGGIIDGEGVVNYIDPTTVVNTVLPTSASLGITLDPQNLAAIQGVGVWNPSAGGSIIPASVVTIANKSAIPLKTSISISLVDDTGEVVLLADSADVNTGTDKNMFLSFVPSTSKTQVTMPLITTAAAAIYVQDSGSDATFAEADLVTAGVDSGDLLAANTGASATFGQYVETTTDSGLFYQVEVPAHAAIPNTTQTSLALFTPMQATTAATVMTEAVTGASLSFALNKAAYYVAKSTSGFTLKYDGATRNDNYDTASFVVSGIINKNADWSDYDVDTEIKLTAVYSFEKLTEPAYTTAMAGKTAGTYNSVAYVAPANPSIALDTFALDADTAEAVTVSLGAGAQAATGITSVTFNNGSTQTLTPTTDYTFSGTTLTFTTAYVNALIAASVTSRTYTVTFNNTAATTDTVTLTYTAPVNPSITGSTFAIASDTPEVVTVSVGAGAQAATGITSVTYDNGTTQTLTPTTDYTF